MKELKDLTPQDIEDVFWKAMAHGWSSKRKIENKTSSLLPGYKFIPFASGDFSVLDAYCKTPISGKSSGFTTIWFKGIPVWTMNYGGEYPKEIIPFLKLALRDAIEKRVFMGGRGRNFFTHEGFPHLSYRNITRSVGEKASSFCKFAGTEEILTHNFNLLGSHEYAGMILI